MKHGLIATALFVPGLIYFIAMPTPAQTPNPPPPAQAPHTRGGAAEAPPQRPVAYPDRPKAPQDVLDRGKATYGVSCAFCHGSDAGGGEIGPNLLRSSVVLEDKDGELIAPIVHGSRVDRGMPRIEITDAQIGDIVAWLHSLHVASRTGPSEVPINILTGNATAGQAFFQKTCASCHSATGDLQGFATRFPDPKTLQQTWMLPGGGGRSGGVATRPTPGLRVPPLTVTVTLPDGQKVEGELTRIDDFYVGLKGSDGTLRGFDREGDKPKVELHDALAPHRQLLHTYTDKNIHDLTAYLVTLK